jgi:hypothetical protein
VAAEPIPKVLGKAAQSDLAVSSFFYFFFGIFVFHKK